jgi:hypothetical protein
MFLSPGARQRPKPFRPPTRRKLVANTTFYVRTDGNDNNPGTANSASMAWLTLQHASNFIAANIDLAGFALTVQVAAGTYSAGVQLLSPYTGSGTVTFQGDTTTPSNVVISVNAAACFQATYPGVQFYVGGFKLVNAAAGGAGLYCSASAMINITGNMEFGVIGVAGTSGVQINANTGNIINSASAWTVSGGSGQHLKSQFGGHIENAAAVTVTMTSTPAFANIALAVTVSQMNVASMTYTGTATGQRFAVTGNSDIETGSGSSTYFPGSISGGTNTGGIYN